MRRVVIAVVLGIALAAATYAASALAGDKLPKCSKPMCRSVGCAADVLCYSGTTVKTCAQVCGN
jgi:hypothetical protein